MAKCPLCAAEVPDDFGLIECAKCSAQLIVHMDGRVEYSGAKEVVEDEIPEITQSIPQKKISELTQFEFGEIPGDIEFPEAGAQEEGEAPLEDGEDTQVQGGHDLGSGEGTQSAPPPLPPEEPSGEFQELPEEPPAEVYKPPAANSPDLSDIANFGNSDSSNSRDGSLRYNLLITGIDTADVREAFREAITDRKLVWDIDQILRSLKNGEVRIQNVTPPKAHILISRLRNLPLHVTWEQYAVSQS